jgi:hypothetical protein
VLVQRYLDERIGWSRRGLPRDWGSSSHSRFGAGIGFEELAKAETELAVEDGAADLAQEIGATAGPLHLLRFVHAAVDREDGRPSGQGGLRPARWRSALLTSQRFTLWLVVLAGKAPLRKAAEESDKLISRAAAGLCRHRAKAAESANKPSIDREPCFVAEPLALRMRSVTRLVPVVRIGMTAIEQRLFDKAAQGVAGICPGACTGRGGRL